MWCLMQGNAELFDLFYMKTKTIRRWEWRKWLFFFSLLRSLQQLQTHQPQSEIYYPIYLFSFSISLCLAISQSQSVHIYLFDMKGYLPIMETLHKQFHLAGSWWGNMECNINKHGASSHMQNNVFDTPIAQHNPLMVWIVCGDVITCTILCN